MSLCSYIFEKVYEGCGIYLNDSWSWAMLLGAFRCIRNHFRSPLHIWYLRLCFSPYVIVWLMNQNYWFLLTFFFFLVCWGFYYNLSCLSVQSLIALLKATELKFLIHKRGLWLKLYCGFFNHLTLVCWTAAWISLWLSIFFFNILETFGYLCF